MANYRHMARQYALKYGINPEYFVRQIQAESGFNPHARSPAGALGIAQIMPGTARGWGVDPMKPRQALDAAAKNMSRYLKSYKGDWRKALAAYNAGPGAVQQYGGVPPFKETQAYISRILGGGNPKDTTKPSGGGGSLLGGGGGSSPADSFSSAPSRALEYLADRSTSQYAKQNLNQLAQSFTTTKDDDPAITIAPSGGPAGGASLDALPRKAGEPGWKYLQRLGQHLFGLQNDPGNSQTTGGEHSANSWHYKGKAVDFGTARNSRKQLNAWMRWLKRHQKELGLVEILDEGDHIHAAIGS